MAITPAYRGRSGDSYIEFSVAGSGDITLSEFQSSRRVICLQGALTGARRVLVPITADDRMVWVIKNETSGDFTLEFGVVSGNSYLVPRGDAIHLYANGLEVSRVIGNVLEAAVTLNSTQIKALFTTPITVVPAPGAGKVLEFLSAVMFFEYGGTNVFVANGAQLVINWGVNVASEAVAAAGFLDNGINSFWSVRRGAGFVLSQSDVDNVALVLRAGVANLTGNAANDNMLRLKVRYAVHEAGW